MKFSSECLLTGFALKLYIFSFVFGGGGPIASIYKSLYLFEKVHKKVICLLIIFPSQKFLDYKDLLRFDRGSFV